MTEEALLVVQRSYNVFHFLLGWPCAHSKRRVGAHKNLYNCRWNSPLSPLPIDAHRHRNAVSGGVDSMVLLTLLAEQARARALPLYVFHIHHGLQAQADDWVEVVRSYCAKLNVVFDTQRLDAHTRQPAQSIEEWARRERHRALAQMARTHGVQQIVLAHHQDDQIETYLQPHVARARCGQAAMPASIERDGAALVVLLAVTRAQIEQYARVHQIAHIHDPSNDDTRFARNAIRGAVEKYTADAGATP